MRRFLIKFIVVAIPFIALVGILFRIAYVTELDLLKRDLTFPPEIRAVVVGDSRVATSFDPEEIPWLRNCGQPATPLVITAQKVKLIVELNPNLELIVVDVWPDSLFRDRVPFPPSVPYGVSLIEVMTRENMPPFGDDFFVRLSQGLLKPGIEHGFFKKGPFRSQIAGGFEKRYEFMKDNKWADPKTYTGRTKYQLKSIPTHGEQVLEDILEWLRKRGKRVVLTSTPLYGLWWNNFYSDDAKRYFEKRMLEISRKYDFNWYNWLHKYQDEMDFWVDGDHLNVNGARQFSCDIKKILESELSHFMK